MWFLKVTPLTKETLRTAVEGNDRLSIEDAEVGQRALCAEFDVIVTSDREFIRARISLALAEFDVRFGSAIGPTNCLLRNQGDSSRGIPRANRRHGRSLASRATVFPVSGKRRRID